MSGIIRYISDPHNLSERGDCTDAEIIHPALPFFRKK